MTAQYRIISIGTLSRNSFWGENGAIRTPHATTTLVQSEDRNILVDPALPAQIIAARLHERSGLKPDQITDVFLTHFRPAHRGGLGAFQNAQWWIGEQERESIGLELLGQFELENDEQMRQLLREEITLLKRFESAPDQLAPQVDLFPMPGFTVGTCGLLLALPHATVLIASDAVATGEHLQHGQVLQGAYDLEQAGESFKEAVEIADWIIPGHDNLMANPLRSRL